MRGIACGLLLAAVGCAAQSTPISEEAVRVHVEALAADSMRGRGSPGPELLEAASYVAAELARRGIEPVGEAHVMPFRHELRQLDRAGVKLSIGTGPPGADGTVEVRYGAGLAALYGSRGRGEGELLVLDTAALRAPGVEDRVAGRVVLALMPGGSHGPYRFAALVAARQGKAAALVLGHPGGAAEELAGRRARYGGALRFDDAGDLVPTIYADSALTSDLIAAAREGSGRVEVEVPWTVLDPGVVPNVAGLIRGSDPAAAGERVLLVAHLDHLGVKRQPVRGDSIYNGADDNASGVAALIEIAGALAARRGELRRSVVVLFTGGEESGLIGARRFAASLGSGRDSVVAVINLDMIGRNDPGEVTLVTGGDARLSDLAETILARDRGLGLRAVVDADADLFRRSDHHPFAELGIPALWLFSGFHDDYHEVTDEVAAVDAGKAARIAALALGLTLELAGGEQI